MTTRTDFLPVVLQLRDGRQVTVRAIRDEDTPALTAAFEQVSTESRYSRFMSLVRELTPAMLDSATHLKGVRDLALVAVAQPGPAEAIVAGARFATGPTGDDCEFAVLVTDAWQGAGLARQLMNVLMRTARERGLRVMEGYVLANNDGMRGLARSLGFSDQPLPDDATVRLVRRALDEAG